MSDYQRDFTLQLTAGVPVRVIGSGDFIAGVSVTTAITVSRDGGAFSSLSENASIKGDYERFELLSGVTQTVTIKYGRGDYETPNSVIVGSVTAVQEISDVANDVTAVSALATATTVLVGANSSRKAVVFSRLTTDPGDPVYIGSASVGAGQGIPLEAGGVLSLGTTAAISAYNASGSAVTVYALELDKA